MDYRKGSTNRQKCTEIFIEGNSEGWEGEESNTDPAKTPVLSYAETFLLLKKIDFILLSY